MKFKLQLFGGGGGGSGGDFKFTGHKMPDTGKPNSSRTRYDKKGEDTMIKTESLERCALQRSTKS